MMKLSQLLEQIEYTCVQGGLDKEIKSVVYDSRKVTPDSLFCLMDINMQKKL